MKNFSNSGMTPEQVKARELEMCHDVGLDKAPDFCHHPEGDLRTDVAANGQSYELRHKDWAFEFCDIRRKGDNGVDMPPGIGINVTTLQSHIERGDKSFILLIRTPMSNKLIYRQAEIDPIEALRDYEQGYGRDERGTGLQAVRSVPLEKFDLTKTVCLS